MAPNGTLPPQQPNVIEPTPEPWQRIAWSKPQEQKIYIDCGTFFSYQQHTDLASRYYDKALEIGEHKPNALYFRSKCKRDMAECEDALKDAFLAAELEPDKPRNRKVIADAYYGLNKFEQTKLELHESMNKYHGSGMDEFSNQIVVVDENLKDTLGDSLIGFFRNNKALIFDLYKQFLESENKVKGPLWKRLKAEHKCDVLSILEKDEEFLSPREIERRELSLKVFNQNYLNRSWSDVMFMRFLSKNKKWCTSQFKETGPLLCDMMATKYRTVKKFIKMLHVRSPLYNELERKHPDIKLRNKHREAHLNYVQCKTRRDMYFILRRLKQLRSQLSVEDFALHVEKIMGDYLVVKTLRVTPWKFEFLNEVYNTLALSLCDLFKLPKVIAAQKLTPKSDFHKLLHIHSEPKVGAINFEFGNKATSLSTKERFNKHNVYANYISRLEKRMHFAKYSIEKCYLWHGMASAQFLQLRYDDCIELSKKGIEESRFCNGRVWAFLCSMLIARCHAALNKIERCKEALMEALEWAKLLNDEGCVNYIQTLLSINDGYIELKKKNRSMETLRRRRSSVSRFSVSIDEKDSRQSGIDDMDY